MNSAATRPIRIRFPTVRILAWVSGLGVLAGLAWLLMAINWKHPVPHHEGIEFGMTTTEVVKVMGSEPDVVVEYHGGLFLFYLNAWPGSTVTLGTSLDAPLKVYDKDGIPYEYNHLQLLFNRNGGLVADTIVGESGYVRTVLGTHWWHDDISGLSEDDLARLIEG